MSRFRVERLLLGCASEGVLLLLPAPTSPTAAAEMLASVRFDTGGNAPAEALSEALLALEPKQWAASAGVASLSVTLDDALTRNFLVTPPAGAQGLRELRASAATRFAMLYGEPAEQWVLAADWQATARFVTCALPRDLHLALDDLARRHAWRLDSVSPAVVRVWNRVRVSIPADGWLVVGFGRTLTLVHTRGGEVASLRSLCLGGTPDLAALTTLVEQERLRAPADAATEARQSLLWAGGANWLPAVANIAGLPSRRIPVPGHGAAVLDLPQTQQLALAGTEP